MTIRTYLTALITVASVAAVASAIAAEGKLKKYVNLVLSLVVMLTVLAPLGDVLANITIEDGVPPVMEEEISSDILLEATGEVLRTTLCEALSLPRDEVQVHIKGSVSRDGEVSLREIEVTLSGDSRTARERVRLYLKSNTDCDIRVAISK